MTAERYLEQIKKIDAIISNKLKEYKRWVDVAEGLGGFSVGEKVQTSRNLQQIPDAIGRYIDIEREIAEYNRQRAAIIANLEKLPRIEYDFLYKLYVEGFSYKEIAYHFDRSYDWVKRKKRVALRLLQEILDESEGNIPPYSPICPHH